MVPWPVGARSRAAPARPSTPTYPDAKFVDAELAPVAAEILAELGAEG